MHTYTRLDDLSICKVYASSRQLLVQVSKSTVVQQGYIS